MGLDSVEIIMEAERLFNIDLPDEKVSQIYTFGAFTDCVHQQCLSKGYKIERDGVAATLRKSVADLLGVDESDVRPESRFIEDLGMD